MQDYADTFDALYKAPIYRLHKQQKQPMLMACLNALDRLHVQNCQAYSKIIGAEPSHRSALEKLPFLAVRLFKLLSLKSISEPEIYRILQSSGTSGQHPANVYLDTATSQRQSKVLVRILQSFLGNQRLPMLIVDAPSTVKQGANFNARAAGIQGISIFGRKPVYALTDNMELDVDAVERFQNQYADSQSLIFGFTFMVWQCFVEALEHKGMKLNLPHATLLHSGGWKKLIDRSVTNNEFKQGLRAQTGISKVHNFYGMAEQVGSVFMECEHGFLHTPVFSDVIARHPITLQPLPFGEQGILQVISSVPTSYPGHSLLSEDLGVVHGEDTCECGRGGKFFTVSGRLPKTEIRGCSDTTGSL